jgi:mannose-6-phosphate isomerase-like protein (cupin superfamily)
MASNDPSKAAGGGGVPLAPDAAAQAEAAPALHRIIRRQSPQADRQNEQEPAVYSLRETLGYVIEGRGRLEIDGQVLMLEPGDCLIMPKGARHRFSVVEPLTMIESTLAPRTALMRETVG